jgi:hypothetical protein
MASDNQKVRNLSNVRTRMQRFADAKCFNAWVLSMDQQSVVVEVSALEGLDMGEVFLFQVSGVECCATFQAKLKTMDGPNLVFQITSPVQTSPPYECARMRTNTEGTLRQGDETYPVLIEDVSVGGMGLLTDARVERWQKVTVLAKTAYGGVKVEGQVRYCKPVQDPKWSFRIGLAVPEMAETLPLFGIRISPAA